MIRTAVDSVVEEKAISDHNPTGYYPTLGVGEVASAEEIAAFRARTGRPALPLSVSAGLFFAAALIVHGSARASARSSDSAVAAQPGCSPRNGQVLTDRTGWTERTNRLEIRNGSRGNAIIKIRDAATGKMLVSFFVESNATAIYDLIPDGSYRFQFAFGDRLNRDCTTFVHYSGAGEFPESERLVPDNSGDRSAHRVLSYTLYPVPSGTVRPRPIDAATFDAP
jgi:hypothetical protein